MRLAKPTGLPSPPGSPGRLGHYSQLIFHSQLCYHSQLDNHCKCATHHLATYPAGVQSQGPPHPAGLSPPAWQITTGLSSRFIHSRPPGHLLHNPLLLLRRMAALIWGRTCLAGRAARLPIRSDSGFRGAQHIPARSRSAFSRSSLGPFRLASTLSRPHRPLLTRLSMPVTLYSECGFLELILHKRTHQAAVPP